MIVEIKHFTEGNEKLVSVPLSNSDLTAVLLETDFDDLTSLGISPRWRLYKSQVVVRNNRRDFPIARLIRDAIPNQRVMFKDRDITNFRPDNLVIGPGPAKYCDRSFIERSFRAHNIELKHS
jgi:hypothetical protein